MNYQRSKIRLIFTCPAPRTKRHLMPICIRFFYRPLDSGFSLYLQIQILAVQKIYFLGVDVIVNCRSLRNHALLFFNPFRPPRPC